MRGVWMGSRHIGLLATLSPKLFLYHAWLGRLDLVIEAKRGDLKITWSRR